MDLYWQSDVSAFLICCLCFCHSFSSKEQVSFNFMAAVTICSDSGAQENKICHCFHCFPIYLPWSNETRCHDLSFLNAEFQASFFTSSFTMDGGAWWATVHGSQRVRYNWATSLSPLSRGSLVPLHFLPLEWYLLHVWSCWYFSQQSRFQLVVHPAQHFTWCILHIS